MPNRYEREIEEILRNLESTEPKPGLGQRFGERMRRRPEYRVKARRRSVPSLHLRALDWLMIIAVVAALIAGGYAYANNLTPNSISGIFAIVGIVCLVLVVLSSFIFRSRRSRSSTQSTRYGNVTPLRSNPLNSLV